MNQEPCGYCSKCDWSATCEARWEEADHLCRVADITKKQTQRLVEAGVSTASMLANLKGVRIFGIAPDTLVRLIQQARLQKQSAETGLGALEIIVSSTTVSAMATMRNVTICPELMHSDQINKFERAGTRSTLRKSHLRPTALHETTPGLSSMGEGLSRSAWVSTTAKCQQPTGRSDRQVPGAIAGARLRGTGESFKRAHAISRTLTLKLAAI